MDTTGLQWYSVHVYYYDEDKDQLLLDCIRPLFQDLTTAVERLFFVRHWLRGPHIRLRFFTTEKLFCRIVKPEIEKRVGVYLRMHPSTTSLNEQKLRAVYEKLAVDERETGPVVPLYPDNSIQYLPYDRRLHVLGSELLADVIERFYAETGDLTFEMLEYIRQGNSRLTLGLDLMFTTAHTFALHITRGFLSYRSHAEGFLMGMPDADRMRGFFEEKYTSQAEALATRLRQVLEVLEQHKNSIPFVLTWVNLMARFWNWTAPLIEAGTLDMMPGFQEEGPQYSEAMMQIVSRSTFHRLFYENSEARMALYKDSWFQTYRLALNLLYLHLARLGVKAFERFMLCHLAANTVEHVFSVSANDMISQRPGSGILPPSQIQSAYR